jgi:hypothetical protein
MKLATMFIVYTAIIIVFPSKIGSVAIMIKYINIRSGLIIFTVRYKIIDSFTVHIGYSKTYIILLLNIDYCVCWVLTDFIYRHRDF